MSSPFVRDLQASLDLECAVSIRTLTGESLITGVKDLNEEENYVVLHEPQNFGDKSTTRTMLLSDIVSVPLHPDTPY
jgi:hypothetical protein